MHLSFNRVFRVGKLYTSLVFSIALLCMTVCLLTPPAWAQSNPSRRISPAATAAQVYQRYPEIPLENQYISSETGTADAEDTLVSRLIRYHVYIKRRPPTLRLAWKLTTADYLGAFDRINAERYPDSGLTESPLSSDIAAIENLSIEERDQLVNALYEAFTTTSDAPQPDSAQPTL